MMLQNPRYRLKPEVAAYICFGPAPKLFVNWPVRLPREGTPPGYAFADKDFFQTEQVGKNAFYAWINDKPPSGR